MAPRRRRRGRCGDGDDDDAMLQMPGLRGSPSAAAGDAAAGASSPASASVAAPAGASSSASVAAPAGASSSSSPAAPAAGRPLRLVYCDDKVMDPEAVVSVGGRARQYQMGDSSVEVTEESRDASQEAMGQAMEAMSEGKLEEAVDHLTKAILLNPTSAVIYSTRASVFIKMEKPAAAIRDANAALQIDSSVEVTEESRDASQEAMGQAMEAMSEGKLEEAVERLTKAILLNPTSAIMYGTRASVFIKMKKPVAAICDADAALKALTPHPLSSALPSRSKPSARKRRKRTELVGVRELASGRFEANFKRGKKQFQCGTYDTKEAAAKARKKLLELGRSKAKKPKKIQKSKKLQDKVKEKQQHQPSGKLKEKEAACSALEKKVEELDLKLFIHQRFLLIEKELQEVLPPEGSSVAGGGHGHGWSPIEGGWMVG